MNNESQEPAELLDPVALPEIELDPDEILDDAAQGVSVTSDQTPDTADEIDEIGDAAGRVLPDDKPLPGPEEIERRDAHRWELDPASAEFPATD